MLGDSASGFPTTVRSSALVCSDQKKRQHTFGDSAGDKFIFYSQSFDLCMGARCDLDKNNVIMVNIEELSEEDQRKYSELQEYTKQQFLFGAKKGSFRRGVNCTIL
jgi:hypothetical protein